MTVNKALLVITTVALLGTFFTGNASAAVITITPQGEAVLKVLASETEIIPGNMAPADLQVKNIVDQPTPSPDSKITLERSEGKLKLSLEGQSGTKQMDVTNITEDIIEIEEYEQPQKILISANKDEFIISQNNILATTNYPIHINSKNREISVKTPSGDRYVSVLPYEAVESIVKANILNVLTSEEKITLSENEKGELSYTISGDRLIELLKLIKFSVPVKASVSASTGQLLEVNQPIWFSLVSFLFT